MKYHVPITALLISFALLLSGCTVQPAVTYYTSDYNHWVWVPGYYNAWGFWVPGGYRYQPGYYDAYYYQFNDYNYYNKWRVRRGHLHHHYTPSHWYPSKPWNIPVVPPVKRSAAPLVPKSTSVHHRTPPIKAPHPDG